MDTTPFPAFVDSHVHLDQIAARHPERLDWMLEQRCMPVSWAWAQGVETVKDLDAYLESQSRTISEIRERGLEAFYLAGIHPRNIAKDLTPADIPKLILSRLTAPACLGVGEVGLEEATDREKQILGAQLELAPMVCGSGKVFGIHTPRQDKERVLAELLSFLDGFGLPENRVVIDHLTPQTLRPVLEKGYWAGVTLSPIKTSAEELAAMLNLHSEAMDRVMVNTDSGTQFFADLAEFRNFGVQPQGVIRKITRDNALGFYNISL